MKVFPIQTATACLLKWAWSTVYLGQGTTASCHRTDQLPIDPNHFADFHNHPEKIRARELMLAGEWPQGGCQYCEKIEAAGGMSDRQFQIIEARNQEHTPDELLTDPTATAVVPTILEIYFNNICNMACVYCGSWFSSKWAEENHRYGVFRQDGISFGWNKPENTNYEKMLADLWLFMDKNYRSLRYFQVLGGEPFYQREFDQCIEFWRTHPNPDLAFNVITNLKVPPKRFREYIDQFEQLVNTGCIKHLQITGSIDAWGPQEEYVRWGLDLAEWEENFTYLLDKDWITLTVNATITGLTIKTMPELVERINQWNQLRRNDPIHFSFMSATTPPQMVPDIFGAGVFDEDFDRIVELLPNRTAMDQGIIDHMRGIQRQIANTPRNTDRIKGLRSYLTELDRRRGTNWPDLFPWLVDL